MKPFTTLQSRVVGLPVDNIDTDQIIPARFLKGVDRLGLGEGLFANWRDDPEFVLNRPQLQDARILISGENFGCGSSREHAAWALLDFGFRAVISSRFGDIFRSNALKNGLLPVELPHAVVRQLMHHAREPAGLHLEIDLEGSRVRTLATGPDSSTAESWPFTVDPFSRRCLLEGIDQLGFLLRQVPAIERWEASRPVQTPTSSVPQEHRS